MKRFVLAVLLVAATGATAPAELVEFDFFGNAGFGLLPGNEVGGNTPVAPGAAASIASGGESGGGLVFNTLTNELTFDFSFQGLSGGLANAASGIHLHLGSDPTDPLNTTGGIAFNLNSGADAAVTNNTPLIGFDPPVSAAEVSTTVDFDLFGTREINGVQVSAQDVLDALFDGNLYLNIHSGAFGGGELRANVVQAVPEPTALAIVGLAACGLAFRRRR